MADTASASTTATTTAAKTATVATTANTSNTTNTTNTTAAVDPDSVKVKFSKTLSYTKGKKVLTGKDVLYMQTCLKYLGYTVNVNSKYDSATAKVAKQFQNSKGLTADGKIGSKTWTAIEKAVAAKKKAAKSTAK